MNDSELKLEYEGTLYNRVPSEDYRGRKFDVHFKLWDDEVDEIDVGHISGYIFCPLEYDFTKYDLWAEIMEDQDHLWSGDDSEVFEKLFTGKCEIPELNIAYYNRLFISPEYRNKGFASEFFKNSSDILYKLFFVHTGFECLLSSPFEAVGDEVRYGIESRLLNEFYRSLGYRVIRGSRVFYRFTAV